MVTENTMMTRPKMAFEILSFAFVSIAGDMPPVIYWMPPTTNITSAAIAANDSKKGMINSTYWGKSFTDVSPPGIGETRK